MLLRRLIQTIRRARRAAGWVALCILPATAGEPASVLASRPDAPPDPRVLLEQMGAASESLRDYTMVLLRRERLQGKLLPEETILIKWARPQRVYAGYIDPHPGREALYVEGRNENRIKAHKGSFPDLTVNLNPRGSMAMKRSHHPMSEGSIRFLIDLLLRNVEKAEARGEGSVRWIGRERRLGFDTDKLELTSPPTYETYTMKKGETLWEVAESHGQPMHAVLNFNHEKGWDNPGDPDRGDAVRVPDYTAGRVVLWLDRATHIPVEVAIYDHEGNLYEQYRHKKLRINVGLTEADFDPDNPDYDF